MQTGNNRRPKTFEQVFCRFYIIQTVFFLSAVYFANTQIYTIFRNLLIYLHSGAFHHPLADDFPPLFFLARVSTFAFFLLPSSFLF